MSLVFAKQGRKEGRKGVESEIPVSGGGAKETFENQAARKRAMCAINRNLGEPWGYRRSWLFKTEV